MVRGKGRGLEVDAHEGGGTYREQDTARDGQRARSSHKERGEGATRAVRRGDAAWGFGTLAATQNQPLSQQKAHPGLNLPD